MNARTAVRRAFWALVAANVVLAAAWALRSEATAGRAAGRRGSAWARRAEELRPLPPRHPPPKPPAPAEDEDRGNAASSARPAPAGPSHVALRVLDGAKAPLSGVTVVATEASGAVRSTVTAADGAARFDDVTPASVELVLSRADLATQRVRPVALTPGVRTIEVTMAAGRAVEGVVLETDGTPLAGATVAAGDAAAWPATATSGYDGRFRVAGLPASGAALEVSAPLHIRAQVPIAGVAGPVEVRLTPACRLYGSVCDASGAPVSDALVAAIPEGDPDRSRAQRGWTGADGRYEIDGMPLGTSWVVEATKPGLADARSPRPLRLDADCRELWCNLVLGPAARLTVRVVDEKGEALPGVTVEACVEATKWFTRRLTGADGCAALDVPGAGTCRVTATEATGESWSADVEVVEGEGRVMEMRRPARVAVAGFVVDDIGNPVAGATVSVDRREARTDRAGAFRVDGVFPGPCHVWTAPAGYVTREPLRITAPDATVVVELVRKGTIVLRPAAPTRRDRRYVVALAAVTGGLPVIQEGVWKGEELRIAADPQECVVLLGVEGFVEVTRSASVRPGETTDLGTIELDPGAALEVRVADRAGRPVTDATVCTGDGPSARRAVTDAAGVARIEGLDPAAGFTGVQLAADGFETVLVRCDDLGAPLRVTLRRLGTLRIVVKDAEGRTLKNVPVRLTPVGRTPEGAHRTESLHMSRNSAGETTAFVPEGPLRVTVALPGRATPLTRDVDVVPGENPPVEITVEK